MRGRAMITVRLLGAALAGLLLASPWAAAPDAEAPGLHALGPQAASAPAAAPAPQQVPATQAPASPSPAATAGKSPAAEAQPGPTIRRDAYGVPHILAASEPAAAFAHGYATAEDHMALLARGILRARGEQASVFGERFLEEDLLVRELGIWDIARDRWSTLPPVMQAILDGYAAGYNLYREQHASSAPAWSAPITGIDLFAHCRAVLLLDFALDLAAWRRAPRAAAAAAEAKGSNMWAIGKGRSRSGHGILLVNPHVSWERSPTFQEVHLQVPGRLNVAGATPVGFPVVTLGFNETLGWSHTINQYDADDVYQLTLDPSSPGHYLYEGRRQPLTTRPIAIAVKTAAGLETRTFTASRSHYGPVIRRDRTTAFAYKSANLELTEFLTQYYRMAKAGTFGEFRAALEMQALPNFNIGYADREGNVFYLFNARVPMRPDGFPWRQQIPGDSERSEWYGIYPLSRLPQLFNPPKGYVQNCNEAPWYATMPEALDRKAYPFFTGGDELGPRGQVSLRALERSPTIDLEEVKRLKFDETLIVAERIKPELLIVLRTAKAEQPRFADAAAVLERWDNTASAGARGAILFQRWWMAYRAGTKTSFRRPWTQADPLRTPSGLGDVAAAKLAMIKAMGELDEHHYTLDAAWGELHRYRRGGLDLPMGGETQTFRATWYADQPDQKRAANGGDSYVLAVEFAATGPVAFSVSATSQSSDPSSPFFNNQATLFVNHAYKRLWFAEADVARHAERVYQPQDGASAAAGSRASGRQ